MPASTSFATPARRAWPSGRASWLRAATRRTVAIWRELFVPKLGGEVQKNANGPGEDPGPFASRRSDSNRRLADYDACFVGVTLAAEQLAEVLESFGHLALDVALGEPALLHPGNQRPRFPDDLNGDRGRFPRLIQPEENFGAGTLAVLDPSKGASRVHVHDLELGDALPEVGREPGASLERTVGLHRGAPGQPLADALRIGEHRVDLVPRCRDTIDVGVGDRAHGAPGPWWTRGRVGLR